jgi:WD40 repeat protein
MPVRARRVSSIERLWRFSRRNPFTACLIGCIMALLMLVICGSLWFGISSQRQSRQLKVQTNLARNSEIQALSLLYDVHRKQAEAAKWSGRLGQRQEGLSAIARAVSLLPRLDGMPEEKEEAINSLRNDAIACLALTDLQRLKSWQVKTGWTTHTAFDSTYTRYAQSDEKGNIAIRRVEDDHELVRLPGPGTYPAWTIEFSPDDRYLASSYHPARYTVRNITVWDSSNGKKLVSDDGPFQHGRFSFSPDSRRIAMGARNQEIRLYELPEGRPLEPHRKIESFPMCVRISTKGDRIAVSDASKHRVEIVFLDDRPSQFIDVPGYIREFAWSHDGQVLAGGCENGEILLWRADDVSAEPRVLTGHTGAVTRLAFRHPDDRLASFAWDDTMRLWDLMSGRQILRTDHLPLMGPFSRDDRRLGFASRRREFGIWEVVDRGPLKVLSSEAPGRFHVGYLPANSRVLHSSTPAGLEIWDAQTGLQVTSLPLRHPNRIVVSPDGREMIDVGPDGIRRWPIEQASDNPRRLRIGPPRAIATDGFYVGFSQPVTNGRHLLVPGPKAGTIIDLHDPTQRTELGEQFNRWSMAISPDGKWTVTGPWLGFGLCIWEVASGKLVQEFDPDIEKAYVGFSPDGQRLAVSTGYEVMVLEVGTWRTLVSRPREGDDGWPGGLAFSPNGTVIATAYSRDRCQLLEAETLERLAILEPAEPGSIGLMAFSPDGRELAMVSHNQIHVWNLSGLRHELGQLGLDWNTPGLPPSEQVARSSTDERLAVEFVTESEPAKSPESSASTVSH